MENGGNEARSPAVELGLSWIAVASLVRMHWPVAISAGIVGAIVVVVARGEDRRGNLIIEGC